MTNAKGLHPRKSVIRMKPYSPPVSGRAGRLRLDFNESTAGCSPQVLDALRASLHSESLAVYPEYGESMRVLAGFFGVAESELLLTNGTDEAIQLLVNAYVDDRDEVILLRPSYAMYRFYSELAGAAIAEIDYRKTDLSFPMDELLRSIRPETRAVILANPNNPTGTALDLNGIKEVVQKAAHAAVLIDEAYYDFCGITALPLLRQYPNLFVGRTFSKAHGLAALRIGCVFSNEDNIRLLHKAQSPYSVNALAAVAARAAVEDTSHVRSYVAEVLRARDLLCAGLDELGIPYFPSRANFILMNVGRRAREIRDSLRERGILVRDRSYELDGCVRVTVGTCAEMARLLDELKELW
jgi:histidinol-phosphate aminotransferase